MSLSPFKNGGRNLHTLRLICKNNGIGNRGAGHLSQLKESVHLHHLHLNVDRNPILPGLDYTGLKSRWGQFIPFDENAWIEPLETMQIVCSPASE